LRTQTCPRSIMPVGAATKEQSAVASHTTSGAKEVESAAVAALLGEVESVLRKPIPSNVDLRDLGGSLGTSVLGMDRSFLDSRRQCELLAGALAAIAGGGQGWLYQKPTRYKSTYPSRSQLLRELEAAAFEN
jgi:hypothetical protein